MTKDIFISYSSKDHRIAFSMCKYLEENNLSCWIAPRNILPGMNYGEALLSAIERSKIFILIFSSSSNSSPQVIREIERAVSKGIKIIPFKIENIPLLKSIEYFISPTQCLNATISLDKYIIELAGIIKNQISINNQDNDSKVNALDYLEFPAIKKNHSKLINHLKLKH